MGGNTSVTGQLLPCHPHIREKSRGERRLHCGQPVLMFSSPDRVAFRLTYRLRAARENLWFKESDLCPHYGLPEFTIRCLPSLSWRLHWNQQRISLHMVAYVQYIQVVLRLSRGQRGVICASMTLKFCTGSRVLATVVVRRSTKTSSIVLQYGTKEVSAIGRKPSGLLALGCFGIFHMTENFRGVPTPVTRR